MSDARRAVAATATRVIRVMELNLEMRVGINTKPTVGAKPEYQMSER
jgi:hypothetical protein